MEIKTKPVMKRSSRLHDLLGSLRPGAHPLEGKSVYMHAVKSRHSAALTDVIRRLGGSMEAFLNRDVSFVVTGHLEGQKTPLAVGGAKSMALPRVTSSGGAKPMTPSSLTSVGGAKLLRKEDRSSRPASPSPVAPQCGSRGRALLEKAMHNTERCRSNDVLASARSWGVKILFVDDFMWCLDLLTERSRMKRRPQTKTSEAPAKRVVKAGTLKTPFIKVEDSSRRYRPLYIQSLSLPELNYRSRFSPFELPTGPAHKAKHTPQQGAPGNRKASPHSSAELVASPSLKPPRRKSPGYCECCQQAFTDQEQHVKTEQHLQFAEDSSNYAVVDELIGSLDWPLFLRPASSPDPQLASPQSTTSDSKPSKQDTQTHTHSSINQDAQTHTHTHSPIKQDGQTHTHTHSPTEQDTQTHTHTHSLTEQDTQTHTHTHSPIKQDVPRHTHTHSPIKQDTQTHTHSPIKQDTQTHTHSPIKQDTQTHTHSPIKQDTQTHTHTHSLTEQDTQTHTHSPIKQDTQTHTHSPIKQDTQTHTHTHSLTEQDTQTHTHSPIKQDVPTHTHTHSLTEQDTQTHTHSPIKQDTQTHTHSPIKQDTQTHTHTHSLTEQDVPTHTHVPENTCNLDNLEYTHSLSDTPQYTHSHEGQALTHTSMHTRQTHSPAHTHLLSHTPVHTHSGEMQPNTHTLSHILSPEHVTHTSTHCLEIVTDRHTPSLSHTPQHSPSPEVVVDTHTPPLSHTPLHTHSEDMLSDTHTLDPEMLAKALTLTDTHAHTHTHTHTHFTTHTHTADMQTHTHALTHTHGPGSWTNPNNLPPNTPAPSRGPRHCQEEELCPSHTHRTHPDHTPFCIPFPCGPSPSPAAELRLVKQLTVEEGLGLEVGVSRGTLNCVWAEERSGSGLSPPVLLPYQQECEVRQRKRNQLNCANPAPKRCRTTSEGPTPPPTPPPDLQEEPVTTSCLSMTTSSVSEVGPPLLYPYFQYDTPTKEHHGSPSSPPTLSPHTPSHTRVQTPPDTHTPSVRRVRLDERWCEWGSSESDWDSGLMLRLAPAVPPAASVSGGRYRAELDLLLQSSTGPQDSSYHTHLTHTLSTHTLTTR